MHAVGQGWRSVQKFVGGGGVQTAAPRAVLRAGLWPRERMVLLVVVVVLLLVLSQLQGPPLLELPSALVAGFRYVSAWRGVRSPAEIRQCNLQISGGSLHWLSITRIHTQKDNTCSVTKIYSCSLVFSRQPCVLT